MNVPRRAVRTRSQPSVRRFDLLRPAQLDILDLAEYAGEYSDRARDVLTDTLFDQFERLAEFPHLGRDRSEFAAGLRSLPVNRLRVTIYYFATPEDPDRVLIARVLRQERDVGPEAFGGGED